MVIVMTKYNGILATIIEEYDDSEALSFAIADVVFAVRVGDVFHLSGYVDTRRTAGILIKSLESNLERQSFEEIFLNYMKETPRGNELKQTSLDNLLPPAIQRTLYRLLSRNYRADPELVRRLVEHSAMRKVMRNVLEDTLLEFVDRVTEWIQESGSVPGMGRAWSVFTSVFGMARNYTKQFMSDFEERITERIDVFVDEMIDEVLQKLVDQLTSEETVNELAQWRVQILQRFLERPLDDYVKQVEAYEKSLDDFTDSDQQTPKKREGIISLAEPVVEYGLNFIEDQTFGEIFDALEVRSPIRKELVSILTGAIESQGQAGT
jgi:hypothetical protein